MSNFSFSHSVFKSIVLQTRKNQGLFGEGLKCEFTPSYYTSPSRNFDMISFKYSVTNQQNAFRLKISCLKIVHQERGTGGYSLNVFHATEEKHCPSLLNTQLHSQVFIGLMGLGGVGFTEINNRGAESAH